MSQKTVKLKGTNFFSKEKWTTVRLAVEVVNKVVIRAAMLAKVYCLSVNQVVGLTSEFYDMCFKVVTGQNLLFRGELTPEKQAKALIMNQLRQIYQRHFENKFVSLEGLSISQIFGAACGRLETCALNNIEFHYVKHLNRYLHAHLGDDKVLVARVRNNFLYGHEAPPQVVVANPLPPRDADFDLDLKQRPWFYLKSMIEMSRVVEFLGEKPLSPIPLRRSYIPKHIDIDSNALVQLLFTNKDLENFVTLYELEFGSKPNLKTKADLGKSFVKVFGREPETMKEDFLYQQYFWKYLCNFDTPKMKQILNDSKRQLYFGNSIVTDGWVSSY